jgi:hypothetical protein
LIKAQAVLHLLETVRAMAILTHVIERDAFSSADVTDTKHVIRVRRLILVGLAVVMALATLAPVAVLAA